MHISYLRVIRVQKLAAELVRLSTLSEKSKLHGENISLAFNHFQTNNNKHQRSAGSSGLYRIDMILDHVIPILEWELPGGCFIYF